MAADEARVAASLAGFLRGIALGGAAVVPLGAAGPPVCDDAADDELRSLDAARRFDAPGEAPAFDLPAARFGAVALHEACRFLVDRRVDAEVVRRGLATPEGLARTAAAAWSADLCLRLLPAVARVAAAFSPQDPLNEALRGLAAAWPLSGVGLATAVENPPSFPDALRNDPCLRTLLADRVAERDDRAAASVDWIAETLAAAAGAYPSAPPTKGNDAHG